MNIDFKVLNINENLISALSQNGITSPTKIQELVIPKAKENINLIGESFTGSGKTLAYLLPLFEKIEASKKEVQSLILVPTHELAVQINNVIKDLSTKSSFNITSAIIVGDANIEKQIKTLKEKPHIIVGTPGRILDLIKKKKLPIHTVKTLILDEADSLLDTTNNATVKNIRKSLMRDIQVLFFSATITESTVYFANDISINPIIIKNDERASMNPNISHMYLTCEKRDKFEVLRKLIAASDATKTIVFVNTKNEIEMVTSKLNFHNKKTYGLYGKITKDARRTALESFRTGKINILVTSDLGARGLDISNVDDIINLDFPPNSKEYLHRAGRTARGNNSGNSFCVICPQEERLIKKYEKELKIKFIKAKLSHGDIYVEE